MRSINDKEEARQITRREFVKWSVATGLALGTGTSVLAAETATAEIPYRPLGRTGEKVSMVGMGGYHIGIPDEQEGLALIRSAIDRGINFMDNCWDYHEGESEARMGRALKDGYRKKVFLMSKIDGQTKAAAARQIDESLKRLHTDHVDLMQFHEVIRMGDPEKIFAPGGSMEAMKEAKQAGKVRFIGFTGHKDPSIHLHMLDVAAKNGFRFDAVQMPLNVMDAHFRSFGQRVVPRLVKEEIAVLGMKPFAFGAILRLGTVSAIECLHYAMNLPTSVVITGIDSVKLLDQAVQAASTYKPMTVEQVTALLARTSEAAASGDYERFKTSSQFDGTEHNPEWLG